MRRSRTLCSLALVSVLWLANAGTAHAAAVWSVLSVNVEGDPQPWLGLAKQVNALRTRLKLPTVTIVQATLAGDVTGTYFVSTEYPSLTALGEATAKVETDPEWPGLLKQLQAASKVVSSELYVDRTPAGAPATPLPAGGYGTGIVVRVDNASAYFALLPKLRENFARLRVPVPRVWQATLAGPETGTILITNGYASLAAMEEAEKKTEADPEQQRMLRELEATGRKVVSRLLVRDRTPR